MATVIINDVSKNVQQYTTEDYATLETLLNIKTQLVHALDIPKLMTVGETKYAIDAVNTSLLGGIHAISKDRGLDPIDRQNVTTHLVSIKEKLSSAIRNSASPNTTLQIANGQLIELQKSILKVNNLEARRQGLQTLVDLSAILNHLHTPTTDIKIKEAIEQVNQLVIPNTLPTALKPDFLTLKNNMVSAITEFSTQMGQWEKLNIAVVKTNLYLQMVENRYRKENLASYKETIMGGFSIAIFWVLATLLVLCTLAIGMHLYVRHVSHKHLDVSPPKKSSGMNYARS